MKKIVEVSIPYSDSGDISDIIGISIVYIEKRKIKYNIYGFGI